MVTSWHAFDGVASSEPVHVWLEFDALGWVRLQPEGDGSLGITSEEPGQPVDMQEFGSIELCPTTPDAVAALLGRRVDAVVSLRQDPPGHAVGWVLFSGDLVVGLANLSDELTVAPWSNEDWRTANVSQM